MEEPSNQTLCQQLRIADAAMPFYILLILAGILAWKAAILRRAGLCDLLLGKTKTPPNLFPIYLVKNAIVIGALTFFFEVDLNILCGSKAQDETAQRSACLEMWAALFALAATLIQFIELIYVQTHQPSLEEEELVPD
ncbi:MAG: hypothetical protein VB071_15435 [Lawsonibacter sp.]|nr:hypothetical protein [Lawsonibacter sp.]